MEKTIWKFGMPEPGKSLRVSIQSGADLLHLGMQGGTVFAWFMLVPTNEAVEREFYTTATGAHIDMKDKYIGTVQEGPYVWHVLMKQ